MSKHSLLQPQLPVSATDKIHWGQLFGSADALAIANAASKYPGPLLVVTASTFVANRLEENLRFFITEDEYPILYFPDWEILPYDVFSPHQDIISQRLAILSRLPTLQRGIVIASISTLMHRLPPTNYLTANSFLLNISDKIAPQRLREDLVATGYHLVDQVLSHGEFAIRGSIIDLFPMGSTLPYRIELFGEEVETIRTFDVETQRSIEKVSQINLLPAKEFPLTDSAITHFRQHWREKFSGNPADCSIYQDISDGQHAPGVEYYLPLFFSHTQHLLNYLPEKSLIIRHGELLNSADIFWQEVQERYEQRRYDKRRPILPPAEIFIPSNELFATFNQCAQIFLSEQPVEEKKGSYNFSSEIPPNLSVDHKAAKPLQLLEDYLQSTSNRILFCAETTGRRESLLNLLQQINIRPKILDNWQHFLTEKKADCCMVVTPLDAGLVCTEPALSIISESQLFGQKVLQRRRRQKLQQVNAENVIRNLAELRIGDPVVHLEHGVGRYLGLQTLQLSGRTDEYLTLEYAGDDKLYVPVTALHLISRYSGANLEHAPMHKLGSDTWSKAKRKAAEKVNDVAAQLLDIYARRAANIGIAFTLNEEEYAKFAAAFPFEETPDQLHTIEQVQKDLTSLQPMDRLVCGDVGFGKTEVAMRAAFIVANNHKQVAILVPTTLLAQQHYQTFKDRFADWPIKIETLSRFVDKKQQAEILEQLTNGQVDIVIGTHKLLQDNIKFKDLGLLIIDEEHRFGVSQKERLKSLRSKVDILTLTATPIPRTLNMALSNIRDLSLITTPPARRLSIKTFVRERDFNLIREACLREILRGGQIYFLHNNVETIEKTAQELEKLLPEAKIAVAHAQMRERELEQIMADFYHRRFNLLICTTIIETGIDIPSANTIIIDRADKFGLAQLHQLRGRVGRSHHQAYAYLMVPSMKNITPDAEKRLDAITQYEDLGIGFTLASHDLEIRGAGEILGDEQSGHIQTVGFNLYMEMLERAVDTLKSGKSLNLDKPFESPLEIDLQISALIPEDYLPDVHSRLILYKRIASVSEANELDEIQVEMIDRFGLLPEAAKHLFQVTELRLLAEKLGIKKIAANAEGGRIEFNEKPAISPATIIRLIQIKSARYQLDGPQRLKYKIDQQTPVERLQNLQMVLEELQK